MDQKKKKKINVVVSVDQYKLLQSFTTNTTTVHDVASILLCKILDARLKRQPV
jgi:hypothetical protein